MATLAQIDLTREDALVGLPMPLTLRPPVAMADEDLIAFSRRNRPYRIEQNAEGNLEIMSPLGFEGGERELLSCANWAIGLMSTEANAPARTPDLNWKINPDEALTLRGFRTVASMR